MPFPFHARIPLLRPKNYSTGRRMAVKERKATQSSSHWAGKTTAIRKKTKILLFTCRCHTHYHQWSMALMMYHGAGTGNTHSQMCMVSCGLDKFVNTPSKFNDFDITMSNWVERNVPEIYPCLPLSVQIRPEGFLFTWRSEKPNQAILVLHVRFWHRRCLDWVSMHQARTLHSADFDVFSHHGVWFTV